MNVFSGLWQLGMLCTLMLLAPCLVQTLLYYILKQDRPSALQDAARVVDTFSNLTMTQAHLFRARFLVENQRVSRMFALDTHVPFAKRHV